MDPSLQKRFPLIFDYIFDHLTPTDRIISGDSGSAYLNPSHLLPPRTSSLPSASRLWIDFNLKYYKQFDINFTGFIINGNDEMTTEAEEIYCAFSRAGMVEQRFPNSQLHFVCSNSTPVFFEIDIPSNETEAINNIKNVKKSLNQPSFLAFRSILQNAEYHYNIAKAVRNDGVIFVDPLELGLLALMFKSYGTGIC